MADAQFEVILRMLFLKINNPDVLFSEKTLTWKSYTTNKALPTIKQVQLVNQKKFVIAAIDADNETFVVHVTIREQEKMAINPDRKAQIKAQSEAKSKTQIRALIFNKAPTEVPAEYSNYSNVFSAENVAELPKNTGINKHAIELKESKQPPFESIYNLSQVELEMLKTYIETNLANGFIWPSKSPARALILFDRKPDRSLRFYINYWGLNNIMIKNQYPPLLIGKFLNQHDRAKRFT